MSPSSGGPRVARAHLRFLALVVVVSTCVPSWAEADWLITPFIGVKFDGETNLVNLDQGAGDTKITLGGSVMLLGSGPIGLEADFGYSPRFFQGESGGLVASSYVMTAMGDLILAMPTQLTRESLRPFAVSGIGLMRAAIHDVRDVLSVKTNFLAFVIGGGAIGGLTDRTSVRFELRRFQTLTDQDSRGLAFGTGARLRFWRADVGLAFRY